MPKATTPRAAARRHNPLADDVLTTGHMRTQPSKKSKRRADDAEAAAGGAGGEERFVDAKMSRKILQIGQELADEDAGRYREKQSEGGVEGTGNTAFELRDEVLSDESDGENLDEWGDEDEDEEVEQVEVVCQPYLCIYSLLG